MRASSLRWDSRRRRAPCGGAALPVFRRRAEKGALEEGKVARWAFVRGFHDQGSGVQGGSAMQVIRSPVSSYSGRPLHR